MTHGDHPSPPAAKSRGRRIATRLGIGVLVIAAVFVLVVFVLPTPLARYVLNSQLEKLGIEHDGIETVDVDLWNSRVRAGPVSFRSGKARKGQLGETGFDFSRSALFDGRAFIRTFYLRGIDVFVVRRADGAIEINGMNLEDIGARGDEAASESAQPGVDRKAGVDVGVERFEFSDSQLVFEDLTGGSLTIDLDRLTLEKLRTWTPQEPTTFTLEGRLNEMEISLDGTVLPLADPIRIALNTRMKGITIERVARFVGSTGLARQEGSLDSEVHYDYAIYRDGRIDGTIDGVYRLAALEVATATGEQLTLGKALLEVDVKQAIMSDGSASAAGQLKLEASPLSLSNAAGDAIEVAALELSFGDLAFKKSTEQRRRVVEPTTAARGSDEAPGTAPSIIELMIGWARELGRNALKHYLEIDGRPTLTLKDGLVRSGARGQAPGQELRFDELTLDLGTVDSQAYDAGWRATAGVKTVGKGLRVAAGATAALRSASPSCV